MISIAKEHGLRHHEVSHREFSVGFVIPRQRFKRALSVAVRQRGTLRSINLYEFALGFKFHLGSIGERDCQGTRPLVTDHAGKSPAHSRKVKASAVLVMKCSGRIKPYLAVCVMHQFREFSVIDRYGIEQFVLWQSVFNPSPLYAQYPIAPDMLAEEIIWNASQKCLCILKKMSRNIDAGTIVTVRGDDLGADDTVRLQVAPLLNFVTGLDHPTHQRVSMHTFLPLAPLAVLFINIVTIPVGKVWDDRLVVCQVVILARTHSFLFDLYPVFVAPV